MTGGPAFGGLRFFIGCLRFAGKSRAQLCARLHTMSVGNSFAVEWIKAWTAMEGLPKCHGEMAGARITDFEGHFGNVEPAFAEQVSGPFHPEVSQVR